MFSGKIRQVSFPGKLLAPLYLQLIYNLRNTVYKCNLFDLFLQPKYGIRVDGELCPLRIGEMMEREEELVGFVIIKHPDDFSPELFKREYDYYCRDIWSKWRRAFCFTYILFSRMRVCFIWLIRWTWLLRPSIWQTLYGI